MEKTGDDLMVRVMASGVFDILHSGHLHYLEEARRLGDELVVVVATDATVRKRKHEPITPERMRLELVSALKPVDRAVLGRDDDMFAVVREICPDIIALGYDQHFNEARLVEELNCRGLKVEVVRLEKHEDDLNGTRKIIGRIIDWYTVNKDQMEKEGRR